MGYSACGWPGSGVRRGMQQQRTCSLEVSSFLWGTIVFPLSASKPRWFSTPGKTLCL